MAPVDRFVYQKRRAQTGLSSCDLDHSQITLSRSTLTHIAHNDSLKCENCCSEFRLAPPYLKKMCGHSPRGGWPHPSGRGPNPPPPARPPPATPPPAPTPPPRHAGGDPRPQR